MQVTPPPGLEVAVPRGRGRAVAWVFGLVVMLLLGAWFATHPTALPTTESHATVSTGVGQPVYVGVWSAPSGFNRTLHVRGVDVTTESTASDVEVTPLLCVGGAVGVTSDPAPFCQELVDPSGRDLAAGDSLVVRLDASAPLTALVHRLVISYRDGLSWGRQPIGQEVVAEVDG